MHGLWHGHNRVNGEDERRGDGDTVEDVLRGGRWEKIGVTKEEGLVPLTP
jgi:hypothetical protein